MTSAGNTPLRDAVFIQRLNRFVARVTLDGTICSVRVPNTGRLAELLLPGKQVVLVPSPGKYPYKIQYVIFNGRPVLIDSIMSNAVFRDCVVSGVMPGFEDFEIVRREPSVGNHRFDYAVRHDGRDFFVEIKSCTLAWNSVASFPDAVSARAAEHIRVLAETKRGIIVFMLLHEGLDLFVPNYHTDFAFYETLRHHKNDIEMRAYSARYDRDYRIAGMVPVRIEIPDVEPRGVYVLVLRAGSDADLSIGGLGAMKFSKGYYIYVGSGMNNLFKRIEYHRRKRKEPHWHIDYLSGRFPVAAALPIVTKEKLECGLARSVGALGYRCIEKFGSSDCSCPGHLFFGETNPLHDERFIGMIYEYRYGGMTRQYGGN
ncbi:MAG TPA: DNA/RNA nuclease SfsA [Spirochaetota bacterium]|nr:DNA/RNA nuclease SfsA [Spirochaetota bacterium]HPC40049.1 DNA/RNA nuclease SfsA [Spirochaetota bacterium]HPL15219.1 DNA/RNA nuclease SfsA [Spirochaetota bacterium]HQF09929.1 DNA/RNA nuclease SfsA [Spirochaetota bacterium]HQH98580.1 DNA/RNA nuclease SfsA [Spirochaetota bacterium]